MKKLLLAFSIIISSTIVAQTVAPLPAHNVQFSGNVRGYWFTAPDCFTITGLEVATEAGAGAQNIAVLRLYAPPPIFSATTNAFTVLFLTQNNPATGVIPCNIQIEQGDIIMILGQRGNINSYSISGSHTTVINGITTPVTRCGMQFPLGTTPPQQLWAQASGEISRVHMTYDSTITFTAASTVLNQSDVMFVNNVDTSFVSVWDYGDGSPLDTTSNDTTYHTYAAAGTYTACNYVTTSCGTDTICTSFTLCGPPPVADYGYTLAGATAMFTDSSTNTNAWMWDFGDSNTSTAQNPTHTYAASGTYYVCLTAINSMCDTVMYCDSITVCVPAVAGFTSTDSAGTFTFMDMSSGTTSWMWDFGDSNTSTVQNPAHTYASNGTYNVCLIASGCASDTFCTTVNACPEVLSAQFASTDTLMTATFTNNSQTAVSYLWNFGDNTTDTAANPVHTYAATGQYNVCLTAYNLCGDSVTVCDSVLLIITDAVTIGAAEAGIFPNPAQDAVTVNVSSTEYSGLYTFEMYDAAGKLVRTQSGVIGQRMTVERDGLADGMYTYKIRVSDAVLGNGQLIFAE